MKLSLLEFSVENFKIFKEKATFSMVYRKNNGKTFDSNGEELLKTSLIFGPNASGKSTLLQGLSLIKYLIAGSANFSEKKVLPYEPFLLSEESGKPSLFEVVFSLDETIYRYCFSILKDKVVTEKLLDETNVENGKELFIREFQNFKFFDVLDTKLSNEIASEKTKESVLFVSAASQWKVRQAELIIEGFKGLNLLDAANSVTYRNFTVNHFKEDSSLKAQILKLLERADFNITDGIVEKLPVPSRVKEIFLTAASSIPEFVNTIKFRHNKFNSKKEIIGSELINEGDESNGTQRFFSILGPIVDTLNKGKVLVIDEFDNSLHPELTRFIVELFEKENPNNAQLIVTTHDTSLLGCKGRFLRSQVWFTAKDKTGSADLFSLEEFRESDLRNDTEFQKKYLDGRFGALPFIDSVDV